VNIVLFTKEGFDSNELFLYMYARVVSRFPEYAIVAVRTSARRQNFIGRVLRYIKKVRRLGWRETIGIISSYPLQVYLSERERHRTDILLRRLPRPQVTIEANAVKWVRTVNGPDAAETVRDLGPDILIQAGAGILRAQMLKLPRIASVNLHHGIAPLIRGMNSIQWALWENRPDWMGSTVHEMDEGIDTGNVLAYAPVRQQYPGEGFSSLFTRATELGVDHLLEVLSRLDAGERWTVPLASGEGVYRSTMSGWKLATLALRLNVQRKQSVGDSRPRTARY